MNESLRNMIALSDNIDSMKESVSSMLALVPDCATHFVKAGFFISDYELTSISSDLASLQSKLVMFATRIDEAIERAEAEYSD